MKGVDSQSEMAGVDEAAMLVAKEFGCVVAATGKTDVVTDGIRTVHIGNGTGLLRAVTGAGCMAGALCAATAAVAKKAGSDLLAATVAGIASMGIAGEMAWEKARLPGSFYTALIDSVYQITGQTLLKRGVIEC